MESSTSRSLRLRNCFIVTATLLKGPNRTFRLVTMILNVSFNLQ